MGTVDKTVYEATGSAIIGDVTIGAESSIWFNAVVRGDEASVNIGRRTSIQDNAVVHTDIDCPVIIGDDVSVGHGAIVHGCTIGDNTIVGMGSIVLNGAHVGSNCIIGAGALVTQGTVIPDGSVAFGSPAKIARAITAEEISANKENASLYVGLARDARTNDLIDAISPTGD
jgi:carbonic anhydrase/acetyltransferase-like protein (isoleucine patch superfamily)